MEKQVIISKIQFVKERLDKLKDIISRYEKAKGDEKEILSYALERVCEQIVETSIKINQEVLKSKKKFAKSYRESFLLLKDYIPLSEEKMLKLARTAHFRNMLAHEYRNLDQNKVIDEIREVSLLYPEYLIAVNEYLKKAS